MTSVQLRIFDTLSGTKKPFHSLKPGRVKMFVCGPTIQDYIHVGHARTYLFYDMLARYLDYLGNRVDFLVNITDIDESIVKGSEKERLSITEFTKDKEGAFLSDMKALGIVSPIYDRVSSHLRDMVNQVEGLLDSGHAYRLGGSVYFDIGTFPDFGRLSSQTPHDISLRPLEIAEGKRNQADFSLWRDSGTGEQKWESRWGRGTPGWHIQDTAVSSSHFGDQYDIHGGARELVYPHHEAQIAERESLTGRRPVVGFWVHSGLLTQRMEKMAKSRGNVLRVRDVLRRHTSGALRLCLLSMHHRTDAEFSEGKLDGWERKYAELKEIASSADSMSGGVVAYGAPTQKFLEAIDDDLHSDKAIELMTAVARKWKKNRGRRGAAELLGLMKTATRVLGVSFVGTG